MQLRKFHTHRDKFIQLSIIISWRYIYICTLFTNTSWFSSIACFSISYQLIFSWYHHQVYISKLDIYLLRLTNMILKVLVASSGTKCFFLMQKLVTVWMRSFTKGVARSLQNFWIWWAYLNISSCFSQAGPKFTTVRQRIWKKNSRHFKKIWLL